MGRLAVVVMLLGSMSAFSQLSHIDGFKKNKYGLYEMSFRDVREAISKYNYVSDMNGADTVNIVYDITKNPIDFAHFGNDIERMVVSLLMMDGNRYKVMFGEFDGTEDREFFTIPGNQPINLIYRAK